MKIVIENGVATLIEEKILASLPENELAEKIGVMAKIKTGFLPMGCVMKQTQGRRTTHVCAFRPQVWNDGIKHPQVVFIFTSKEDAITNVSVFYSRNKPVDASTVLRHTAHRNVYQDGSICLGVAFPTPAMATVNQKINAIVGRYFTASKTADLDGVATLNMPNSIQEMTDKKRPADIWQELRNTKADISGMVEEFKRRSRLGDIIDDS